MLGPTSFRMKNRTPDELDQKNKLTMESKPPAKPPSKADDPDLKESTTVFPKRKASDISTSDNTVTPVKKKRKSPANPWKKPKDMPKRPLSAYNLFFKEERYRLLSAGPRSSRTDEKAQTSRHSSIGESDDSTGSSRRQHVKVSGIGFANLAKLIGAKWNDLDDETRLPFVRRAAVDKQRYDVAVAEWRLTQKNKKQNVPPDNRRASKPTPTGFADQKESLLLSSERSYEAISDPYPSEWFETTDSSRQLQARLYAHEQTVYGTSPLSPRYPTHPGAAFAMHQNHHPHHVSQNYHLPSLSPQTLHNQYDDPRRQPIFHNPPDFYTQQSIDHDPAFRHQFGAREDTREDPRGSSYIMSPSQRGGFQGSFEEAVPHNPVRSHGTHELYGYVPLQHYPEGTITNPNAAIRPMGSLPMLPHVSSGQYPEGTPSRVRFDSARMARGDVQAHPVFERRYPPPMEQIPLEGAPPPGDGAEAAARPEATNDNESIGVLRQNLDDDTINFLTNLQF
jgi:hypothetical protein